MLMFEVVGNLGSGGSSKSGNWAVEVAEWDEDVWHTYGSLADLLNFGWVTHGRKKFALRIALGGRLGNLQSESEGGISKWNADSMCLHSTTAHRIRLTAGIIFCWLLTESSKVLQVLFCQPAAWAANTNVIIWTIKRLHLILALSLYVTNGPYSISIQ